MSIEQQEIPEVDPRVAFDASEDDRGIVIDVREQDELQQMSISGAVHIPLGELHGRVAEVPSEKNVYVLCHVGQRSALATQFLRSLGHHRVWNIRGGVIAWLKSGLPIAYPGEN